MESVGDVAALGDWGDALGQDFVGDAEYRIDFQLSGPEAARASTLDLGPVSGVAEVVLNGVPLGRRPWEPFRLHLNGAAADANTLRVTATNTRAAQFLDSKKLDRWPGQRPRHVLGPGEGLYKERALRTP